MYIKDNLYFASLLSSPFNIISTSLLPDFSGSSEIMTLTGVFSVAAVPLIVKLAVSFTVATISAVALLVVLKSIAEDIATVSPFTVNDTSSGIGCGGTAFSSFNV